MNPGTSVRPGTTHGPNHELVEEGKLEAMAHISPDGRAPHEEYRRKFTPLVVIVGTALILGLAALVIIGGVAALGMALVYLPILLVAAFPVWLSGMFRQTEEKQAVREGRVIVREWQMAHGGRRGS